MIRGENNRFNRYSIVEARPSRADAITIGVTLRHPLLDEPIQVDSEINLRNLNQETFRFAMGEIEEMFKEHLSRAGFRIPL